MWARVHKLDKVRAQPKGGAIVLIEDERTPPQINRVPSLSTLIAIARVLAARRALEVKFDGKGEVRYVTSAVLPSYFSEAITKAGAAIADRNGDNVVMPASPSGVSALIDVAFSELAHHVRGSLGVVDVRVALERSEKLRRAKPLDRDKEPQLYWPAVLELAALAGEQSRARGGRWVDTTDLPVAFALKFADGKLAHPTVVAQRIVEGIGDEGGAEDEMLATETVAPAPAPIPREASEPNPVTPDAPDDATPDMGATAEAAATADATGDASAPADGDVKTDGST